MKIINQREMPLLNRVRVTAEIEHLDKSTPSRDVIKKELAGALKVDENLIAIRHIYTKYGFGKSKVIAHVYKNLEDLERLDTRKVVVKKEKVEAKKEEIKEKVPVDPKKEVKEDGKEKGKEQKA